MKAVLLVGGPGTRMRPLTYVMPKCLLPLGGKPLLERTIQYLGSYDIKEFVLCVAYLKKQVMDAFKDGSQLGVNIEYAEAETPLGTAGQLKTAERFLDGPFIAMNGDIVTNMNISGLLRTHEAAHGIGTIAVKKFEVKVPYGNISTADDRFIARFDEKPTLSYMANAGVYAMERRFLDSIPQSRACSLEREIFPSLLAAGEKFAYYYEDAYWADVGSMSDFERVNDDLLANEETKSENQ